MSLGSRCSADGEGEGQGRRPRTRRIVLDGGAVEAAPAATSLQVERFLDYVRHERGLAANTQAAYKRDLRDFAAWLGGRSAAGLSVRDLGDYLRSTPSCSWRAWWRRARRN